MFESASSAADQLHELGLTLGFDYDGEDWGIVNADGRRVADFVNFFDRQLNDAWLPGTISEYFDLVMESACDALRKDSLCDPSFIDSFVALAAPLAPRAVEYWMRRDWAITPHLSSLGLPQT